MPEKTADELKIEEKGGSAQEAEVSGEERETPDVEADFLGLLKDYGVAEKAAKTITKHIAETGTADIFEDPRQLLEKMAKFSRQVPPVTRRNILDHWITSRHIPKPEGFEDEADLSGEVLKERKGKEAATPEKYTVDTDTGAIKVASTSDKALTWDEAEKLAKEIKKDIEIRAKKEGSDEPIFVLSETGAWTLNPKAKVGTTEFAVFQMYQDSLRKGEPIDPVEELTRREEQMARLKDAMGVKPGGEDSEITILDKLDRLGMLKKGEGEGGLLTTLATLGLLKKSGEEGGSTQMDMLTQLNQLGLLKTPGGEGEGSRITALMEDIKNLRESLQKQEVDNLKSMVGSLSTSLSEMRKEIADGGRLEGRYALMEKTIATIDNQLSGIRSDARPFLAAIGGGGGGPSKRSPEEKAKVARGLKEAVVLEEEAKKLEDELLFGGKQG